MRALCHVQNEATSVNSRVLRRGQFSRGLSIVPLAGYNCLSNLRPWGEFALSISRGSPALHTVPETIDRCIASIYFKKVNGDDDTTCQHDDTTCEHDDTTCQKTLVSKQYEYWFFTVLQSTLQTGLRISTTSYRMRKTDQDINF